jgi:hypothetical protein
LRGGGAGGTNHNQNQRGVPVACRADGSMTEIAFV